MFIKRNNILIFLLHHSRINRCLSFRRKNKVIEIFKKIAEDFEEMTIINCRKINDDNS